MAAPAPLPMREPSAPDDEEIFTSLVVSDPKGHRRGLRAFPVSISVHVLAVAAFVLIPLYWSGLPSVDPLVNLIYDPPAAMAAPLPKGRAIVETQLKPKPVTPDPHPVKKDVLQEPVEVHEEQPTHPENRAPDTEQVGSETGSDMGIPEGMEGGKEGGVAGGVLDGQIGGCVGCTGNGPVVDADEGPRLLRQVKPVYPQDAFVKKVEGTVLMQAIVDATGHVIRPRVVRSIPILDPAAIACVQQWLFEPAKRHGTPVAISVNLSVQFRIF